MVDEPMTAADSLVMRIVSAMLAFCPATIRAGSFPAATAVTVGVGAGVGLGVGVGLGDGVGVGVDTGERTNRAPLSENGCPL